VIRNILTYLVLREVQDTTITRIDVHSVFLRFIEPFRITYGTSIGTKNLILKLFTDDNLIGYGEASPSFVTKESNESIVRSLDKLAPTIKKADNVEIDVAVQEMDKVLSGNPSAKAAVDIALHDIHWQRMKEPLFKRFGGFREITTDITISSGTPSQISQEASAAVNNGFTALKIKTGFAPEEDIERVKAVRNTAGPNIALRIDANQGWKVKQTLKLLEKLEAFDLEFIEQPVKANDFKGLRKLRKHSSIPIMADESVCSPKDASKIIKDEAADLINIKLIKSGGLLNAKQIIRIAEQSKIPCMMGCMCESNIGITAAVHLAAGMTNVKFADLDSDILLKDNLVIEGGAALKYSKRIAPSTPGLGIAKLDEKLLGKPIRRYMLS
jgi:L-alanine-DL-glutamate epimerase-like enolase superfamily enzyme